MKPIIKVQNLSKQYELGAKTQPYSTLREKIYSTLRSPFRSFSRRAKSKELFWALNDVSFEVEQGEIFGIIGRNGAGKSTLLKILARVTEPTVGRVELYGRTNSLLEVGTGFHPELTGRENIFVNGAILGLKKHEIKGLFDSIVNFAEVEQFIDTAVKHYSSGMYLRLAFSVAAHLDPDILIIDEVLSVGDAEFQKKCVDRVRDVAKAGRTVLFVSHNLATVENLCDRAVVLERGKLTFIGDQGSAITHYLNASNIETDRDLQSRADRVGSGEIRVTAIKFRDAKGNSVASLTTGQDAEIIFDFERSESFTNANVIMGFMVRSFLDVPVFLQHNRLTGDSWAELPVSGTYICRVRRLPLPAGIYRLGLSVMCNNEYLDRVDDACQINVVEGDFYGTGEIPPATHGLCLVDADWRLEGMDKPAF